MLGRVIHASNFSSWKMKPRQTGLQGHSQLEWVWDMAGPDNTLLIE